MAILKIIVAPDPRLKIKAQPVATVDDGVRKLMDDMLETMYAAPGIGLAATQVGVAKRVIVVDIADTKNGEKPNPLRLANPEVVWQSDDTSVYEEGCLSLPQKFEEVTRPARIKVRALNEKNQPIEFEADDLLATCIQHEIDHLDGVIFVDHISRIKRDMILRKLTKEKKLGVFDPKMHAL
jgi:peptide deformylase